MTNFSVVLMNPPYDGSLHLKFLQRAIDIADKVISVQPVRWLEDYTSRKNKKSNYNKYEESISKHISNLEIISAEETKKIFAILITTNIGIYSCDKDGGFEYKTLSENGILEKILEFIENNKCNFEFNKKDGYRVRVPFISGGKAVGSGDRPPTLTGLYIKDLVFKDGRKDGKWWYEFYTKNQYSKTTEEITSSIKFDTEEEGHNFVKSLDTDFMRYVESQLITDVNIGDTKILWMGNVINPRTGKKGYKSEWLDSDFELFFDLSEQEIEKYKSFMKEFEDQVDKWYESHKKIRK